ncbi:DUF2924 domain-containing protein [Aestuariivirga sp.]|jgi:hypothetical protein|uniref:DUF2924 domain-containing protein n=1 Tax=Aestuariivirga sp. TaxID=2650926 RepID=UPI003783045E
MSDQVLARLAALKTTPTPKLKEQWRQLFESEPPAFNRRYLESRLAYRIQELAYGGLKPETVRRLEKLGEELDGGRVDVRKRPANDRPISGTRLIREYQGVEHCVTVRDDDFEYQGRPYKSLSAIARVITGTPWSGPVFFGLKSSART